LLLPPFLRCEYAHQDATSLLHAGVTGIARAH
jgi:hypothetical protein